ncbi:hypothetical protein IFR05_011157 [Cadophora sp. M221]|nr:hypothetical protein IFR05_011157 [Cadophora sp. M221]
MADAILPSYDTMNHYALCYHCKSRGLEVPKGAFKHKLIEILARDHLQKNKRRCELELFDENNDPGGFKRATSINESCRVQTHFARLELQSLADYHRGEYERYLSTQKCAEDTLVKKLRQLSINRDNLLSPNTVRVQAEQLAAATPQANGSASDSAEEYQSDVDSLFEERLEGGAENPPSGLNPLIDSVPEKDAENNPDSEVAVETRDTPEVIESSHKRAKPDHDSSEEEDHTTATKRQRLLDFGGLSEDMVNALTKNPETGELIQPFNIPGGTIGEKLRAQNLMIIELAYESSGACFSLEQLHHYK